MKKRIVITYTEDGNPKSEWAPRRVSVEIDGNGAIDHLVDAFKAALYSIGFHPDTIQQAFNEEE